MPAVRITTIRPIFLIAALILSAHDAYAGVKISRLDCGQEPQAVSVASFSDTMAFPDLKIALTYSCYLICNGDEYLIWDTGLEVGEGLEAPIVSITDQLKRGGLTPRDIKYIGLSHYHYDHTGQLPQFAASTLLIGEGDWKILLNPDKPPGVLPHKISRWRSPFSSWLQRRSPVTTIPTGGHDVFGDGRVRILPLPGHTPGHQGLLVKLKHRYILLSGDVTHFRENYANYGVPIWNTSRADSLASLDRFKNLASNLSAEIVIQHDPRDIDALPKFPYFAE